MRELLCLASGSLLNHRASRCAESTNAEMQEAWVSIQESGVILWRKEMAISNYFLPGKFHGQSSLEDTDHGGQRAGHG